MERHLKHENEPLSNSIGFDQLYRIRLPSAVTERSENVSGVPLRSWARRREAGRRKKVVCLAERLCDFRNELGYHLQRDRVVAFSEFYPVLVRTSLASLRASTLTLSSRPP